MLIPDPDFYPSRIRDLGFQISEVGSRIRTRNPDPATATKEEINFVATNITKLETVLFLSWYWYKKNF
jgi:hypothetical protein